MARATAGRGRWKWWSGSPRAASASTPSASAAWKAPSCAPAAAPCACAWTKTRSKPSPQATDGAYFNASTESDLRTIYENLSLQLVFRKQETEITALFTGAAAVLSLIAGTLSLLWFNRLP